VLLGRTATDNHVESGVAAALNDVGPESVTGISIVTPEGATIELSPDDGGWSANGYPADSTAIQSIWGGLEEASVESVVATNPANHARMGVGADSTWTVGFERDDGSTTILIGDTGPSFSTAYVRLPDEDAVVLVDGGMRGALARPLDRWRDRTIFTVDTSRVARIRVERGVGETVLERGPEGWTAGGEPARESTVQNLLGEAARFVASGFMDEETPRFEGNERHTVLEAADGTVLAEVRFYGNGTTQHAVVPANQSVFEIQNWKVDRLTPTRTLALPADPGG